jgi:hypothetical protein
VRPRHPNKDIEAAIKYAESKGWRYQATGNSAHAGADYFVRFESREEHSMSIWSTPKNPDNHAKQIRRNVDACDHQGDNNE